MTFIASKARIASETLSKDAQVKRALCGETPAKHFWSVLTQFSCYFQAHKGAVCGDTIGDPMKVCSSCTSTVLLGVSSFRRRQNGTESFQPAGYAPRQDAYTYARHRQTQTARTSTQSQVTKSTTTRHALCTHRKDTWCGAKHPLVLSMPS